MMRKGLTGFILVLLTLLSSALVSAQTVADEAEQQDVFAPFVSRLRVAVRDPQVRITWRDSEDLDGGTYQVLRSLREITPETVADATVVARITSGIETWLDTPPEPGDYFYAVLAEDSEENVIPILVPFRNKTIRPVTVTRFETEEDLAVVIQNIAAQNLENEILLRFDASRSGRTVAVYRSTEPFEQLEDIAGATLIDELDSATRRLIDYPVPGILYYYGVFDSRLIERGTVEFDPGNNVLAAPVQIELRRQVEVPVTVLPAPSTRRAPLPILQPSAAMAGIRPSTEMIPFGGVAQPVRVAVERAITRLIEDAPAPPSFEPVPVVLPEERTVVGEGAARTLAQIVDEFFIPGEYQRSAELLENLLALPLSPEFSRRVRFYRGQALYFTGKHREAFLELLLASRGSLYEPTRPWIDGILLTPFNS